MIYHDVLGVTVLANSTQIEEAYNNRIDALKKSKFDIDCPAQYSRKVKELSNAKEECLSYISKPFREKVVLEADECMNRALSPNVTNSCCCGQGCETFCTVTCWIAVIGAGIGIAFSIKSKVEKYQNKQRAEEYRRRGEELKERRDRELVESASLNNDLPIVKRQFEEAKCNHTQLRTGLELFESKLSIVSEFLDKNGVSVDLRKSQAYGSLKQQTKSASAEELRLKNEISRIESELKTIEDHDIEYQRHQNNMII